MSHTYTHTHTSSAVASVASCKPTSGLCSNARYRHLGRPAKIAAIKHAGIAPYMTRPPCDRRCLKHKILIHPIITIAMCSHPSRYAVARTSSSTLALSGNTAPCNTACASSGLRRLGNSVGNIWFSAVPMVCGCPVCCQWHPDLHRNYTH
jgi:hypothetical protein